MDIISRLSIECDVLICSLGRDKIIVALWSGLCERYENIYLKCTEIFRQKKKNSFVL